MTAKRLQTKIVVALHSRYSAKSPRGKKKSSGLVFVLFTNSTISILVSSERPKVEALLSGRGVGGVPFGDLPSSLMDVDIFTLVSITGDIVIVKGNGWAFDIPC